MKAGEASAEGHPLPGSAGEHRLQDRYGTARRAQAFYNHQMLDHLSDTMCEFIRARDLMFISTADAAGNCDCSIRAGLPGFVCVADAHTLAYPEYRGNGVMASLGNLAENPRIGLLVVDFLGSTVGCHVNGAAHVLENDELLADGASFPEVLREAVRTALEGGPASSGRRPERWVVVHVEEAYIHCSKHIPHYAEHGKERDWGTDDPAAKGGDFFKVRDVPRPWWE